MMLKHRLAAAAAATVVWTMPAGAGAQLPPAANQDCSVELLEDPQDMPTTPEQAQERGKTLLTYLEQVAPVLKGRPADPGGCANTVTTIMESLDTPALWQPHVDDYVRVLDRLQPALAQSALPGTGALRDQTAKLQARMRTTVRAQAQNAPEYGLNAGVRYQLTPSGAWRSGVLVNYRATAKAVPCESRFLCDRFRTYLDLDFGYHAGGSDSALDPDGDEGGSQTSVNPFEAEGGVARIELGWIGLRSHALGLGVRGGISSLITDREDNESTVVRVEPHWAIGPQTFTRYVDGAVGTMFVGIGQDYRWQREYTGTTDAIWRGVFDGRLQLARLGANWQLLAQAEASVPLSGDAGSELAVALLLNYELGKLLPGLGGGAATP